MAASASPIDSFMDSVRTASETAASTAKTRANSALFEDHLSAARAQNAKRRDTETTDDSSAADKSAKSKSASAAHHSHRHSAEATAIDQSGTTADQTTTDVTPVSTITSQADPLTLLFSLSNGIGTTASDATAGEGNAGDTNATGGKTDPSGMAADASKPGTADAASLTPDPVASKTTPTSAETSAALQASTPAPSQIQTQAADSGKPFILVKPGAADLKGAPGTASKSSPSGADPSQQSSASGAQPVKVVVQPKAAAPAVQPASENAIAAQQDAAAQPEAQQAAAPAAPSPLPVRPDEPSETAPQAASAQISIGAAGGVTASAETGHKSTSGGNGSDDLLNDGSTAPMPSATAPAEAADGNATGFAALVAGTAPAAQTSAAATASSDTARAPQVPPPPAEQVAFGLSRLTSGANSFSMQLDPERLGSVSVQLEVDAKGKAKATFSAERPETLALMRQDSHHLLKALQDAGVKTDQGSLHFSLKDQSGTASQERRPSFGAAPSSRVNSASSSDPVSTSTAAPPAIDASRLYDLHA